MTRSGKDSHALLTHCRGSAHDGSGIVPSGIKIWTVTLSSSWGHSPEGHRSSKCLSGGRGYMETADPVSPGLSEVPVEW